MTPYPVFGICGYSGSGKTTLIEALVARLRGRGLAVGVIKQDAHGLGLDREGKDTDRIFKAGADVLIRDAAQVFARLHRADDVPLGELLKRVGPYYDLILAEGHKTTPLPYKIWLCKPGERNPPPEASGIRRVVRHGPNRVRIAMALLDAWLSEVWRETPVCAGILIGGESRRMGRAKHLLKKGGRTWLESVVSAVQSRADRVVVLGRGEVPAALRGLPVLPDIEDAAGPLRGMLAALRWAPHAGWVFAGCDQPDVSPAALDWLLAQRRPGVRAVLPVLPGAAQPEPLLAYYDFRAAPMLEGLQRPRDIAGAPGVETPTVPRALCGAWRNVNSPADLHAYRKDKRTP